MYILLLFLLYIENLVLEILSGLFKFISLSDILVSYLYFFYFKVCILNYYVVSFRRLRYIILIF